MLPIRHLNFTYSNNHKVSYYNYLKPIQHSDDGIMDLKALHGLKTFNKDVGSVTNAKG
jgi:hypothetical protein